ncbi:MAG: hypothetical protein WBQ21_09230 [Solirubrobacteraceae bacterium]
MPLWLLVLMLFGLIKIVIASLMLWLPYRSDVAANATEEAEDRSDTGSDDEGGSKVLPGLPTDPHPRLPLPHRPRRGPHGSPSPASPSRVRRGARRVVARSLVQR